LTGRWLPAFHDLYVMVQLHDESVGGQPGRKLHHRLLLPGSTPWEVRCTLLEQYGIQYVFYGAWETEEFAWVPEVTAERWTHGGYILARLDVSEYCEDAGRDTDRSTPDEEGP
jgi:hypothetical protein